MIHMTLEEQYIQLFQVIKESRNLLAEKLYNYKVINENQYLNAPFYDLLECIDPITMNSHTVLNLPDKPIEDPSIPHIQSKAELKRFLYKDNKSKIIKKELSLVDLNYIILKKTLFYKACLRYHLSNMNVDATLIRQAKTIKELIRLLDFIDRKKYIQTIVVDINEDLYYQAKNEIEISIIDDSNNQVNVGNIEIYLNGSYYDTQKVSSSYYIIPSQMDSNTIKIKYIPNNYFFEYESQEYTFNVIHGLLVPHLKVKDTNINSTYYNTDYQDVDPFYGCGEDTWDINVLITNSKDESINMEIPFEIYLENNNNIIIDSITNIDGSKTFNNITIPYHNNDFINDDEIISSVIVYPDPEEYDDDEILENLNFIKNLNIDEDDVLTYDIISVSPENYIDELNDCITNVSIVDDQFTYDFYHTAQHIKIKDVNNLKQEIGNFVTNIIYYNDVLYIETANRQEITIHYGPYREYLFLIIKTKLNSDIYTDDIIDYQIALYYPMLDIDDRLLTWYKDSDSIPSQIPIRMIDIHTGRKQKDNRYKLITIQYEDNVIIKDYFSTPIYNLIPSNELPDGKTNLTINICTNASSYISQKINWENITELNFYYKSKDIGLLDVYIGSNKIASLEGTDHWTLFTYNNIQDIFLDNTQYNQELKIVNKLSYANVYIKDIYTNNTNNIKNGDFQNGLQYWKKNGEVIYQYDDENENYYLDLLNEKECYSIKKEFNILSNFEIPDKNVFYLPHIPKIYYKPLGQVEKDKEVILYQVGTQRRVLTDENGLLNGIVTPQIGQYSMSLQANSDNVTERIDFSYEIKKPFVMNKISNTTKQATYEIIIYDLEHTINIKVFNGNNEILPSIQYNTTNQYTTCIVTILRDATTIGTNNIEVTLNEYTETDSFTLSVPEINCITNVSINNGDLIIQSINRTDINNTNIINNISISDKIYLSDKNFIHSYDNVQNVLTNINFNNGILRFTTYDEDD